MELDNLIFDRTQSDVNRVQFLTQKMIAGTATEAEKAEWLGGMKGAYNASDLNRVCAAVDYLTGVLTGLGYSVTTTLPEKKPVYTAKEIEYIESTGTQYIDTLFKPNQDTRITMSMSLTDEPTEIYAPFGSRNGNQEQFWPYINVPSLLFYARYGASSAISTGVSAVGTNVIDFNKNVVGVNGASVTASSATFQSSNNAYLFAVNNGGETLQYPSKMKLYSCKIYDNGVLVRDFKPYYDSNGVACLFDAVSGTYYYNAGTGAFTASEEPTLEMAYWSENDIPMQAQMETYLENIQTLRDRLPYVAPDAPNDMTGLTYQEANNIEEILYTLERVLLVMQENFKLRQSNTFFMTAGGVFNNA